jgi:hypothetical protein
MCVAAAVAVVLGCAGSSTVRYGDQVDVSKYPADIQSAYRVFAVRCSRCHTLARPLNARITDPDHWVRYVTRMRRNPSSGINPKDADIILSFLLYYTKELQAAGRESGASAEPVIEAKPSLAAPPSAVDAPPHVTPVPDVNMPASEPSPDLSNGTTDGRAP